MKKTERMVYCGIFIAVGLVIPFLTAQNKQLGQVLCLMHIPVLLCGFVCGKYHGLACGFTVPLLRSVIFGMPMLFPDALNMSFELAAYGFLSGLFYRLLPKKILFTYLALILSMLGGRAVYGVISFITYSASGVGFEINVYLASAFITPWMGIALQLIVIVPLTKAIKVLRRKANEG